MAKKRWIVPWKDSLLKPVIYHCISRVVDRNQVFGPDEKEKFRAMMRMQESFSGCRVLCYCLMNNHIHLLLEVPPMPAGGLTDDGLLARLRAIYSEAVVAGVAEELREARKKVVAGLAGAGVVEAIHQRYIYRMHDLSEFMKTLMQRFTQWFNRSRRRTGNLWEDAFRSVIVEDGVAAKTMAAYIDLNPVRAGVVTEPAQYRWSSYGEAIGGGPKGNGKRARAGLVRALRAHQGAAADAALWAHDVAVEYRKILLAGAIEKVEAKVGRSGKTEVRRTRKGMSAEHAARERELIDKREHELEEQTSELSLGKMLRCRIRYFTAGAVIGSRGFVNEVFAGARDRFGPNRKDGARKLRGSGAAAAGLLWSVRELRKDIGHIVS